MVRSKQKEQEFTQRAQSKNTEGRREKLLAVSSSGLLTTYY